MFTKLIKNTGIAALLVLSAFLLAGVGPARASDGTGTHNASGTYDWSAGTGTLTLNWTSSDFTCDGPELATETKTGVTVTATKMTWADDGMTWTRSTGTEGDIVSAWTSTDSHTGNSYTLTFNTDGTVSVTGVIVQCGDSGGGNPPDPFTAFSYHDQTGYYAHVFVNDPSPAIYSGVNVTGPGLPAQGVNLVYNNGQWWSPQGPILSLGPTLPTTFPSFHFVATKNAGGTDTMDRQITGYVTDFITVNSPPPSATINTAPVFSWTWPGATSPQWYGINIVNNTTFMQVWSNYNIPGNQTSINYTGPALTSGHQYNYSITAGIGPNSSMVNGTFTFNTGSGGGTISMSGILNGVGGQPISGAQIEQVGNAAVITTTDSNGNFILTGLPAGTNFTVKMSKTGDANNYAPFYTQQFNAAGSIPLRTYTLFTEGDLNAWGVTTGGGVIRGRVADNSNVGTNNLSGAVVTVTNTSNPAPNYTVKYQTASGALVDGPGTFANGVYFILNVQEGDVVTVSAAKPEYNFTSATKTFITHAGGVSQGNLPGAAPAGAVTLGGYVQDNNLLGLGGVQVEAINEASGATIRSTTSQGPDGVYSLPVPLGTNFYLRFSKTGYYPTYTAVKNITQYFFDDINKSYNLFTSSSPDQFDSTHWDVTAGQGVIRARVKDQSGNFVAGATVTYTSSLGNNPNTPAAYPIFYADNCKDTTFTATQAGSGRYCIKNVAPSDTVTVTAQNASWTFNSPIFHVNSGGVFQGSVIGTLLGVDDTLIRDRFAAFVAEFNKGASANIDTIMSFFSLNYLDNGRDFNAEKADMQYGLNRDPFWPITGNITTLVVTGNTATMTVDMGDKLETLQWAKEGDGVWRVIGNQARHEVRVSSQHWQNGYSASISVGARAGITSVTVSGPYGPGIIKTETLAGPHDGNGWWFDGNGPFWSTPPVVPLTYNITVYEEGKDPSSYQRTITGFVTDFAVPTSPSGSFGSPVVFTWRGIAGATEYSVELNTEQGQRVWSKYNLPANQWLAVYDGQQPLTAGNYNYNVVARKTGDGGDGYSFASGTFTYTGNAQATVTYTGHVFDKDGVLVTGVLVEQLGGYNTSNATSDENGGFMLGNLLAGVPSYMQFRKDGYAPTYRYYQSRNVPAAPAGTVAGPRSIRMYTTADLSAWGVTPGKGIIRARVEDGSGNPSEGATVLVTSALGKLYTVNYCDINGGNCRTTGGTDSSGNFSVLDVEEGDMVVVTAQKTGLTFNNPVVWGTHANGVHIGWVRAMPQAINLVRNGDFSNGLNEWNVAPSLGDWNPLQPDGTVRLQPSNYAYMGTIISQNLNLTNIAGKTVNFSLNLTSPYPTSSGKTVAVYLTYYDTANVMLRVKIFSPDNNTIGTNTPFNVSYSFPADAGKLVKLEIAKEDYGEFLVDNIGLTGDGIAAGPLPTITNLSANSGPYGSTVTITGSNFGTVQGKVTIRGVSQQINSWSDNSINITILDPTASGHLSVTTDFVQSNRYEFDITSPYYTVNLLKNTIKVIKGQKAEFVLNVQTFNNYSTAQGINFANSDANLSPLSFFTPLPVKNDGGVIMRIDTTNLAVGNYQGNIQANDSLLATRTVPFTLQVVTASDIKFFELVGGYPNQTKNYITAKDVNYQGQFGEYNSIGYEVQTSDSQVMNSDDSGMTLTPLNPSIAGAYLRYWGYDLYALSNGTTALRAQTPDGTYRDLTVTVAIPAEAPQITSISLNPANVSNKGTDNSVFFAATNGAPNYISSWGADMSGLGNFNFAPKDANQPVYAPDNSSVQNEFHMANPPADLGLAVLYATASRSDYSGSSKAAVPLTTFNDPSYAGLRVALKPLDTSMFVHGFNVEFYDPANVSAPVFTKNVWSMGLGAGKPVDMGGIPPGTYKLRFVGMGSIQPQWWPNAANADGAVPINLAAGQMAGDIFYFALPVPTDCSYAMIFPPGPYPASGMATPYTVSVTAGVGCAWTATTMDNWLHITGGSAGSGNGIVNFTVDANTGTARTATITIAGQSFTVNQTEAANLVQNGDFTNGLNGWTVAPTLGDWNPLQNGMVSLNPPAAGYSGYLGTVIFQNLNLTNIAGKRINFFLNLTNQYAMSSGKTIAVYLTYYDSANVMHRVKIFSPDNSTIGMNTPFNISYDVPVDAAKLVKLEIVKEDYGEFLVDNIGLTGDGIAVGPLPIITNLSASSGSYGSTVTITGNNFGTVPGKVTIRGVSQQINSWSDNSINITILDPTASGHLSVTADFVQSNRYEFDITSPYYSVNLMKNNFKVIKGQKAEFVLNVQTFNNYSTVQGINFTNSNASLNALFTPLPIKISGGVIMRIDTTNLAAGTYQGNIQANDGSNLATRMVPFTLQVVTVTDIKFYDSTYDSGSGTSIKTYYSQKDVTGQGSIDFGIWNIEATASDGSLLSGVPFTFSGYDPALIGIYRGNSGMVDFFAEGANGQTSVNVVAPDEFTKSVSFNINIPPTPRINSLGLSPAVVTNAYAEPLSFFAAGTQSIGYGRYGFLNIKEDTRGWYDEGRSVSGTFKLDLTTPPELGTYLFNASIGASYPAAAEKVVALTITNDPSYALMKGGIRSIDSALAPYNLEHFSLEFYNALGVKEFSRDYSGFMHYEEPNFAIGAIPPGTYRIKFVAGSPTVKSQWWPNADNMSGALPVTFVAGGVRDDYYFFAATAPTIFFAGSVRDSAGNPLAGVNVEALGFDSAWTTTDDAGNFTLNGIPAGQPFTINLWKWDYVETYSGTLSSPGNIQAPGSFTLLTTAEVSPWQVGGQNLWQAGKGMIMSRVVESGNPAQAVGGAQISVTSAMGKTYGITYFDAATFGGTATAPNGIFYIYGIEAGDTVTVTAFKEGWAFNTNTYEVRADGISEQLLFGTPGVVQTVSFYGAVRDKNGNPIMGATIETVGLDPVIQATSDGVGNFVLSGIPMNQVFHLKISMAGYLPTYTRNQSLQGNAMVANRPFVLRTAEQVYTGWGVIAGKSVVEGRVFDAQDPMDAGIGGVVITAVGNSNRIYTVTYKDDAGNSRTDRTYGNGRYFVLDADPGDTITVTANKPSWSSPARVFTIHADGISQGNIPGSRTPAGVWGGQDIGREAYGPAGYTWWVDADRITITDNTAGPGGTATVSFNRNEGGTVTIGGTDNFSYSSFIRNPDGTYTMWSEKGLGQPPEAVTMAISDDGSMITLDGAMKVGDRRLDMLIRIDPAAKTYGNSDLAGDYYGIGYEYNANLVAPPNGNGTSMAISTIETFNGAGSQTYIGRANSDGQIWTDDQRAAASPYTVNPDGSVHMGNGAAIGYLSGNGNILSGSGSYLAGNSGKWAFYIFLKKADKVYSAADLAGTWAFASYGDNQGNTRSEFGTLTCDAAGICNVNGKTLNDNGTTSPIVYTTTLTVGADGRFANAPGSTVPLGAIGNGGRTIIWNLSFNPANLQERRIVVATKLRGATASPINNKVWAGTHYDGLTFYGDIVVEDPNHTLTSVTVTGPGIATGQNLIYRSNTGSWTAELNLGSTAPADSYYTITLQGASGTPVAVQQRINGGVAELATNLSPTGDRTGKITFDFTRITGADGYSIDLFDATGNLVWSSGKVLATSFPYDGPPLPSGNYYYAVHSWIGNNCSVATASFNYTAAVQYPTGDLNHDRQVDLADAIIALRAASGLETPVLFADGDVNNDGTIGMAEALFAMQTVAGLRVTDHQAAVNGVLASLADYTTTINNKGAAITPADLLPFFHPTYLDDGLDRNMAAQDDLPDGVVHIDAFTVNKVLFFDDVRKIITAEITFTATVNSIPEIHTFSETFAYDQTAGKWLRFGNQRIGEFSVWLGKSREMPVILGAVDTLVFHPHFTAPPNTVSQVAVSGPALGGTVIYGNPRSETANGITIERFHMTSQGGTDINFSQPVPAVGDTYTMAVTKKTGGVVTYTQVMKEVMLDAPTITSPASHELTAASIGSPLNVTWTLPSAGIGLDEIRLEGQVCSSANCQHVEGTITSLTTGTITLPNMGTTVSSAYVDVRIHKGGEVFTNCRFEFGN